jgi:hypothetical protein
MDLGATVCTPRQPRCLACPVAEPCVARREGRQEELPGRRRRAAVPSVEIDVAWVVRRGRWLLMRRAPRGLYGGLWELPEAAALGLVAGGDPLVTHVQKLTHRTLVYRIHPLHLAGRPRAAAPPYDAFELVDPRDLGGLAVSSATAAIAKMIHNQGKPWPTPQKRRSSSPSASPRSSRGSSSSGTTPATTRTSTTPPRAPRAGSAR